MGRRIPATALNYAKAEYRQERFPAINIQLIAGSYYLSDADWNLLKDRSFPHWQGAAAYRSKILDKARNNA